MTSWIVPNWPAPASIEALSTTRRGGVSDGVFQGLNLGNHVGDDPSRVLENRKLLQEDAHLPAPPAWLNQVHGTEVMELPLSEGSVPDADAAYADKSGEVCCIMTADCLPVLFCSEDGQEVAAAHAGWRGLLDGVLENTLAKFTQPQNVMVWFGPAIGPDAFEVGPEVREQFVARQPEAKVAFKPHNDRWLADIYQLARLRLEAVGVSQIFGGEYCTHSDPELFYSYRRDGKTGRQATLIWRR